MQIGEGSRNLRRDDVDLDLAISNCAVEGCFSFSVCVERSADQPAGFGDHEARRRPLVVATAPALVGLTGAGVHTAAELLITAGDNPDPLRSEAAFAHPCAAAPIPASSGKVTRHRLHRGGDRNANHALWRIVMVRMTCDPRTREYVAARPAKPKARPNAKSSAA